MRIQLLIIAFCHYSQFMDDNDDAESQKFLSNGMMKKKKYEEYHEEYVRGFLSLMYSGFGCARRQFGLICCSKGVTNYPDRLGSLNCQKKLSSNLATVGPKTVGTSTSPVQVLNEQQGLPWALFCLKAHSKSIFV